MLPLPTVSGGPVRAMLYAREIDPTSSIEGMPPDEWALWIWLPSMMTTLIGSTISIFVPLWEYCVLFPSEVRIWKRLARLRPFRWQFAPLMTLFLRYTLVVYAFDNAVTQYSTSNTDVQCAVQSVFFCATLILISSCAVLAMAWRTNAVVRGVLQNPAARRTTQLTLAILALANIVIVWVFLIQSQWTGSWSGHAEHGICTTDATGQPKGGTAVVGQAQFWYYVLSLMFDSFCAITISLALQRLASRSHGFSKLIHQLLFHSVGYFVLIILLMLLGIIWLRVQNAFWAANFIQVLQGAIVVRILMSEQEQAQRPHDSDYHSEYADEEATTSYLPGVASGGSLYPSGTRDEEDSIAEADTPALPLQGRSSLETRHKRWSQRKPIITTSHHHPASGALPSPKAKSHGHGEDGYSLRSLRSLPSDPAAEHTVRRPGALNLDLVLAQTGPAGAGAGTGPGSASASGSGSGPGPQFFYDSSSSHAYPPAARQHRRGRSSLDAHLAHHAHLEPTSSYRPTSSPPASEPGVVLPTTSREGP